MTPRQPARWLARVGGVEGHGDQLVVDLAGGPVMLVHANHPTAVRGDHRVRKPLGPGGLGLGGQRARFLANAGADQPQPLVLPVGEDDGIPMDGIATAAVLVDLTPGGESGRDDVDRRVAGSEGHDDLAAGFVGSTFVPVHPADVHL